MGCHFSPGRCWDPVTKKLTEMIGVEIFLEALMISLMRGTPSVTFMAATPAKWNVFSVICVPGSPILCAPNAPTVDPAIHIKGCQRRLAFYGMISRTSFRFRRLNFGLEMTCLPIAALTGYSTFLCDQGIVCLLQMCSSLQDEEMEATVRIRMYLGPSSFHHSGGHTVGQSSGSVLD